MTKKQKIVTKKTSTKKVKFNLEKPQTSHKQIAKNPEEMLIKDSHIKSILKVKTSEEQLRMITSECQPDICEEENFSKKCELALEKLFNDNIDLFLKFFKKYDQRQKE